MVCRYGGEEFAVVLPATHGTSAATVADKLRRVVANTEFPGVPYRVTVSVGVAEFPANGITRDDIVGAADGALYAAKEAGRNQVCLASASAALSAGNETPSAV
jgi:diguanylate cyclase (GGDEF)-like protein